MQAVTYVPGRGVAVVGPGVVVLLPAETEPRLALDLHAVLVPGVGVADVLQVLTGEFATSLARLPAFALAVLSPGGVHAVARGDLEVRVGEGPTVSGAGVATWTERFVAGVDDVALLGPGGGEGGESWPVLGGVVRADAVIFRGAAAGDAVPEVPVVVAAPVPELLVPEVAQADLPAPAAPEPAPPEPVAPAAGPGPTVDPGPTAPEETVVPTETILPSVAEPEDSFDHLWGSTVLRPVEQAAVRADEPEDDDIDPVPAPAPTAPRPAPAVSAPAESAAAPVPAPAEVRPAEEPPSAPAWTPPFTLDVPAAPPPAPTAPAPTPTAELGDHDGETVVRAPFEVVLPERGEPIPRPTVGLVRLSTGQEIELDRPVVVGRKPRVSRVGGTAVPRLVSVPSPEQDISRSHLEIRLEGISVLVVDLGSTNGSTLLRAGQLPVRLHPHEAALVVDGDVVDLGEGVTLTFEGLA